jgi:hypothetical protein
MLGAAVYPRGTPNTQGSYTAKVTATDGIAPDATDTFTNGISLWPRSIGRTGWTGHLPWQAITTTVPPVRRSVGTTAAATMGEEPST